MTSVKAVRCPCLFCSPHLHATQRVEYAPGTCAPLARLIDSYELPDVWISILPFLTNDRIHRLMCVSKTTVSQIGLFMKKELTDRVECSHQSTLQTGVCHCFALRKVAWYSECLRCGIQAHWHAKVWDEVDTDWRPVRSVQREEARPIVRVARWDLEELAGRLDRLALE